MTINGVSVDDRALREVANLFPHRDKLREEPRDIEKFPDTHLVLPRLYDSLKILSRPTWPGLSQLPTER